MKTDAQLRLGRARRRAVLHDGTEQLSRLHVDQPYAFRLDLLLIGEQELL